MAQQEDFLNAVKQGDGPGVEELLRRQPELITVADEYDKTALHWAAEKITPRSRECYWTRELISKRRRIGVIRR